MRNMIHGPCGDWCLDNGNCSKHYPKQFREETTMNENGYPYYRRRNTGLKFERCRKFMVDNTNVVPYSPMLLCLLNCHINVEIVSSIKSVKYMYKYIWVIPREIYNSKIFSHETFFKMFFKQFKFFISPLYEKCRSYEFFSFRSIKNLLFLNIFILFDQMIKTISFYPWKVTIV